MFPISFSAFTSFLLLLLWGPLQRAIAHKREILCWYFFDYLLDQSMTSESKGRRGDNFWKRSDAIRRRGQFCGNDCLIIESKRGLEAEDSVKVKTANLVKGQQLMVISDEWTSEWTVWWLLLLLRRRQNSKWQRNDGTKMKQTEAEWARIGNGLNKQKRTEKRRWHWIKSET